LVSKEGSIMMESVIDETIDGGDEWVGIVRFVWFNSSLTIRVVSKPCDWIGWKGISREREDSRLS